MRSPTFPGDPTEVETDAVSPVWAYIEDKQAVAAPNSSGIAKTRWTRLPSRWLSTRGVRCWLLALTNLSWAATAIIERIVKVFIVLSSLGPPCLGPALRKLLMHGPRQIGS